MNEPDSEATEGRVIRQRVEYWIQELRPGGGWIDFALKHNAAACVVRIQQLKDQEPQRTFRPIARVITDKAYEPAI